MVGSGSSALPRHSELRRGTWLVHLGSKRNSSLQRTVGFGEYIKVCAVLTKDMGLMYVIFRALETGKSKKKKKETGKSRDYIKVLFHLFDLCLMATF